MRHISREPRAARTNMRGRPGPSHVAPGATTCAGRSSARPATLLCERPGTSIALRQQQPEPDLTTATPSLRRAEVTSDVRPAICMRELPKNSSRHHLRPFTSTTRCSPLVSSADVDAPAHRVDAPRPVPLSGVVGGSPSRQRRRRPASICTAAPLNGRPRIDGRNWPRRQSERRYEHSPAFDGRRFAGDAVRRSRSVLTAGTELPSLRHCTSGRYRSRGSTIRCHRTAVRP